MHLQAPPERAPGLLAHLRNRPDVKFAEFDSIVQAPLDPNDPYYSTVYASSNYGTLDQWGPPAVSAPGWLRLVIQQQAPAVEHSSRPPAMSTLDWRGRHYT